MADVYRIETIIDRFFEYVRQNRKISLKNTAAVLGLTVERAEQIALLLEANNLIEMQYGLTDVMLLAKQKAKLEEAEGKSKPIERPKTAVEKSYELEREVLTTEGLLKFFEKDLERRIARAEQLIAEIEKQDKLSPSDLKAVRHEVDLALNQLSGFSHELKGLTEKEEHFYQRLMEFKKKLDKIKPGKAVAQPAEVTSQNKVAVLFKRVLDFFKSIAQRIVARISLKKITKQAKTGQKPVAKKQRVKPRQNRASQPAITFLGHGFEILNQQAERAKKVKKRGGEGKYRLLEKRVDKIKQHYWLKKKRLKVRA